MSDSGSGVAEIAPSQAGAIPAAAPAAKKSREFRSYMIGYCAMSVGMGLNQVLNQYLIVVRLHESAEKFALAQTAMMLPMLALIMFGGAVADRTELRAHMIRLQLLWAVPPVVLTLVIGLDYLSFAVMIVYGVSLACVQAFVQPARDSFLTNVTERTPGLDIPRAVAAASAVQFLGQIIGSALVGMADTTGPIPLLIAFSSVLCLGALFTSKLSPADRHAGHDRPRESFLKQFEGGIREVMASDRIRPIVICMFLMGLFGMGGQMVIIPLLLHNVYHGGALVLSGFNIFFMSGTFVMALTLSYLKPIRHQGRVLVLAMFGGILAMTAMHFMLPLYVVFPLVFLWGTCGGLWMAMSRAILQENAPVTHRARILAVFSLGFVGGGPLGALLAGQLTHWWGPQNAILFPPFGMLMIVIFMTVFTRLWHLERPHPAR